MRRLAFSVLLALWAAFASSPFTARPQPSGDGGVAVQEHADAGPMHRSARAWRVAALVQAPLGLARDDASPRALGSTLPGLWRASCVGCVAMLYSWPGTAEPRRHYPLFPTGPPQVHTQA